MAIKRYIANADNTIFNAYGPDLDQRATGSNAGKADVLDVFSIYGRYSTSSVELARTLVKFPVDQISTDRTAGTVPASGSVNFYLRLYDAENSRTVPDDFTLTIMAVSQSWQEGDGLDLTSYKDKTNGNIGSNWMSASNAANSYWKDVHGTVLAGGSYLTQSVQAADPGSFSSEIHVFNKAFTTGLEDLEVDITPLVEQWMASTYSNYGVGIMLSASYEGKHSGSADGSHPRTPGEVYPVTSTSEGDSGIVYNPSGSTVSYYLKRFFSRGTQYFFKRPCIEARWDDSARDNRGNFYLSSSLANAVDNINTLYFYNYIRGELKDLPNFGPTSGYKKEIYVSIFSGNADNDGIFNPPGGYASAACQYLSVDGNSFGANSANLLVATGGIVSTGIYSCSFAFTGAVDLTKFYDVWFTGSLNTLAAFSDGATRFFTGSVEPMDATLHASEVKSRPTYYINITNIKDKYRNDETARFELYIRERGWSPTIYTKANEDIETINIQSASYRIYRVLDGLECIPYGTGSDLQTMLSYDVSGNYFDFDMSLLDAGYEYALKFSFYDNSLSTWKEQPYIFKFRVEDYEY
jgi:hypothetical protein